MTGVKARPAARIATRVTARPVAWIAARVAARAATRAGAGRGSGRGTAAHGATGHGTTGHGSAPNGTTGHGSARHGSDRHGSARRKALLFTAVLVVLVLPALAVTAIHRGAAGRAATSAGARRSGGVSGTAARARTPLASLPPAALASLFSVDRARDVSVATPGFWSWALLDRSTGAVYGYQLSDTSDTASMIKPWLAADYLRRADQSGQTPPEQRLADLSKMIRDSDNTIAENTYRELGGEQSIDRLISVCGLTDTRGTPGYWSKTEISAEDTVRMGACLADGRAAGWWTSWLINEMRNVRGFGTFGIKPALPADAASVAGIKDGWLLRDDDDNWYVNCMAIVDTRWVLGVLTRYDGSGTLGASHGAGICSSVTSQLLAR